MSNWIDRINEHAAKAAIEKRATDAHTAVCEHLKTLEVKKTNELAGHTVRKTVRTSNSVILLLDGLKHVKLQADSDYDQGVYLENWPLTADEGIKCGLVPEELSDELCQARAALQVMREEAAGRSQLEQAIALMGKDKVKELLDD